MRDNVRQGLRVLRGIPDFLRQEVDAPVKVGSLSKHIDALDALNDRLQALAGEQEASDRGFRGAARQAQQLARTLRREYLRPVARMGKYLLPLGAASRVELDVPSGSMSYQALTAIAQGIAARVQEHSALYVAAGFSEDFVDKMRAAAAAVHMAQTEKSAYLSRRVEATSGLILEFARARQMVRMLDDMVAPLLEGTERLAAWKSVSRFARRTRRDADRVAVVTSSSDTHAA